MKSCAQIISDALALWRVARRMGARRVCAVLIAPALPELRAQADLLEDQVITADGVVALAKHDLLGIELHLARLKAEREAADWWRNQDL